MLSKEEIENKINLKDRTKYAIEKSKKIIKEHKEEKGDCSIEVSLAYDMQYVEEYIDQLESDKQKLIEKLEKDIREETGYARWTNSYTKEISPAVTKMISKSKYAQEILSVLKGENHE